MYAPKDRVLFGAAYYHEYQPSPRLEADIDLMAAAHFSVIRVGESVWSTWEPEDGRFDLDWLQPVLDGAHARGIGVVLGTPTYAIPMWLARTYPEIAAESATGQRVPWGGRQEVDYTHSAFRFHAERVIRKIIARYADHPAVIGYQVDNEPGIMPFHNEGVFQRFVDELRHRYADVDALNQAWGLTYWSHRLSTWADLWRPDGNYQPQYDLAWRSFQARLTTEFIAWQAGIVGEYAREDQFVTTCISYERPGVDDANLTTSLDVTAGNPYYAMQDGLTLPASSPSGQAWMSTGTWTLFEWADRAFSSKQAPFLITETNAGPIGGSASNYPAWDGQWRQAAYAFIARGAEMIEYWHWHSIHFGTETYWMGILPHDQQPGRIYDEIARLGGELKQLGRTVVGLTPDAQVGMLWSARAKWGLAGQPVFTKPGVAFAGSRADVEQRSYAKIFGAFYEGAFEAGVPVRIVHDDQVLGEDGEWDPAEVAAELPVLVVPGLLVADDALLTWLRRYAWAGGHLVLGIRTGYGDELGRARVETKPALLADAAAVSYQEFSNVDELALTAVADDLVLSAEARATGWVDGLITHGAKVLAEYDHPHFARFPSVTTVEHGAGRITTVGTVPNRALGRDLLRWLVPDARAGWGEVPASVTISSAATADGDRLHVVHNWSWDPQVVTVTSPLRDLLRPDDPATRTIALAAWDVRVLAGHVG